MSNLKENPYRKYFIKKVLTIFFYVFFTGKDLWKKSLNFFGKEMDFEEILILDLLCYG